ncbi:LysM peptidoglycan-binding domain-containing protein [Candidatus Beckwithbacteria bacterium]|nr:LysM peptidoglycan-binding domain-containing protein [Candidatus Beckwithbacteria bacterium]
MDIVEEKLYLFLKKVKLSEEIFSTIIGSLVVFVVLFFILSYFQHKNPKYTNQITSEAAQDVNYVALQTATPSSYLAQEGDSLQTIARVFYGNEMYWTEIAAENQIDNPDLLTVGQKIILPEIASLSAEKKEPEVLSAQNTERFTQDKYVVQAGDTLEIIAQKAYGDAKRWMEISQANNLYNPDLLYEGLELAIPRD